MKYSYLFFTLVTLLMSSLVIETLYLHVNTKGFSKTYFLNQCVGLPDLSIVSETRYIRHRSLSDTFSYFGDSPELSEYFPSTFVYAYTPNFTKIPSEIRP